MKKLSVVLALILVLSVAYGAQAAWVDGTYVGWSDATDTGTQSAKVFIEGGKIVAVILREYNELHIEKDFAAYPWPQAGEAARSLGAQFVANQAAEADIVTGATGSSKGYIQAVERALVKADAAKTDKQYFDGVFLGRSEVSGFGGYYKVVWVTLADGKVVDYKALRVLPDHTIQDPSVDVYGWPLELAREGYKEAALASEPGFVDVITGATGLTAQSNHAVRDALDKARIQ